MGLQRKILFKTGCMSITNFSDKDLSAEYAKRGTWYFVPLFNKETGNTGFAINKNTLSFLVKKTLNDRMFLCFVIPNYETSVVVLGLVVEVSI